MSKKDSFASTFEKAHREQGPGHQFQWGGKAYTTDRADGKNLFQNQYKETYASQNLFQHKETYAPQNLFQPKETHAPQNLFQHKETFAPQNLFQHKETYAPQNLFQPKETYIPQNLFQPTETCTKQNVNQQNQLLTFANKYLPYSDYAENPEYQKNIFQNLSKQLVNPNKLVSTNKDENKNNSVYGYLINKDYFIERVKLEEDCKLKMYKDSKKKWTIGVGHLCDEEEIAKYLNNPKNVNDITQEEADNFFRNDCKIHSDGLKKLCKKKNVKLENLDEGMQNTLADMEYNMGESGFEKFNKMWDAVKKISDGDDTDKNRKAVANEIKDSDYYHQVKNRADRNIEQVITREALNSNK